MNPLIATVYFSLMMFALDSTPDAQKYWPQWRGPSANGVALHSNPPLQWSEEKNIKWKIEVPGKGLSSPIVWEDKVFITTAISTSKNTSASEASSGGRGRGIAPSDELDFVLLAISRADGRIIWQRKAVAAKPHEGTHPDGSWASHSPITDGQFVFAYFGSRGLYCYDMLGKLLWQKDFGDMSTRNGFGEGSSPVLRDNILVVNWDHEDQDFIVALDKKTGKELWNA